MKFSPAKFFEPPQRFSEWFLVRYTPLKLLAKFLFMCKEGSRNAFNNDRANEQFLENYQTLSGKCLPHMDTVDDVLRELNNEELEKLKGTLVGSLIEQKVFGKFRLHLINILETQLQQ